MNPLIRIAYFFQDAEQRRDTLRRVRARYGKDAVRFLVTAADDKHGRVVSAAVSELGMTGAPEALAPLVELLEHSGWDRELWVLAALGELRDPRAIPAVAAVLTRAIGTFGVRHEKDVFGVRHEKDVVRCACKALGRMGKAAYPFLSSVFSQALKVKVLGCDWETTDFGVGDLIDCMNEADSGAAKTDCLAAVRSPDAGHWYKIVPKLGAIGGAETGAALKALWIETILKTGWDSSSVDKCGILRGAVEALCPGEAAEVVSSVHDGSFYEKHELTESDVARLVSHRDRYAIRYFASKKDRRAVRPLLSTLVEGGGFSPSRANELYDLLPALAEMEEEDILTVLSEMSNSESPKVIKLLLMPTSFGEEATNHVTVCEELRPFIAYWHALHCDEASIQFLITGAIANPEVKQTENCIRYVQALLSERPAFLADSDMERLLTVKNGWESIHFDFADYEGERNVSKQISHEDLRTMARTVLQARRKASRV